MTDELPAIRHRDDPPLFPAPIVAALTGAAGDESPRLSGGHSRRPGRSAAGCRRAQPAYGAPWDDILARMPQHLADRIARPEHEVQLLYTRIDRDAGQRATLTRFPLQLAPRRWFTAASWVKLPAVLLAAERLGRLGLGFEARIVLDAPPATGNWDSAEPLDEPFGRRCRRLLRVSEDVPFDPLYEYLGQRELGEGLNAHGYPNARLIARLGSGDAERNRAVGAARVLRASGAEVENREARTNAGAPAFPFGLTPKAAAGRTTTRASCRARTTSAGRTTCRWRRCTTCWRRSSSRRPRHQASAGLCRKECVTPS